MMALRGDGDLIVATPGRSINPLAHNALSLSEASILVIDDADRLAAREARGNSIRGSPANSAAADRSSARRQIPA
jgi:hypothetical protein